MESYVISDNVSFSFLWLPCIETVTETLENKEASFVTLVNWTIAINSENIFLQGFLENGIFWRSTAVKERISFSSVVTFCGTVCYLAGPFNQLEALYNRTPYALVEKFLRGFPRRWEQDLKIYFQAERSLNRLKKKRSFSEFAPGNNQLKEEMKTRYGREVKPVVKFESSGFLSSQHNTNKSLRDFISEKCRLREGMVTRSRHMSKADIPDVSKSSVSTSSESFCSVSPPRRRIRSCRDKVIEPIERREMRTQTSKKLDENVQKDGKQLNNMAAQEKQHKYNIRPCKVQISPLRVNAEKTDGYKERCKKYENIKQKENVCKKGEKNECWKVTDLNTKNDKSKNGEIMKQKKNVCQKDKYMKENENICKKEKCTKEKKISRKKNESMKEKKDGCKEEKNGPKNKGKNIALKLCTEQSIRELVELRKVKGAEKDAATPPLHKIKVEVKSLALCPPSVIKTPLVVDPFPELILLHGAADNSRKNKQYSYKYTRRSKMKTRTVKFIGDGSPEVYYSEKSSGLVWTPQLDDGSTGKCLLDDELNMINGKLINGGRRATQKRKGDKLIKEGPKKAKKNFEKSKKRKKAENNEVLPKKLAGKGTLKRAQQMRQILESKRSINAGLKDTEAISPITGKYITVAHQNAVHTPSKTQILGQSSDDIKTPVMNYFIQTPNKLSLSSGSENQENVITQSAFKEADKVIYRANKKFKGYTPGSDKTPKKRKSIPRLKKWTFPSKLCSELESYRGSDDDDDNASDYYFGEEKDIDNHHRLLFI